MIVALLLAACATLEPAPKEWPVIETGAPLAGAAEGTLDLPVGTPMGGYSARCTCLSGWSRQDSRDSAYSETFVASTGVHMRAPVKVIWLEIGGEPLVIAKADAIYSYDGLVAKITADLEAATGQHLQGKVILSTSHTHAGYGAFTDDIHFYLGSDRFNQEIFERFAGAVTEVALAAYAARQPAAIGTGWAKDWDPTDAIYRDRRGVNNELQVWPDGDQGTGKDPWLNVLRVDTLDGDPIAMAFTFGIHGIALGDHISMLSPDSSGGLEQGVQEGFDTPVVVMHLQGAGGDASPSGRGGVDFARIESLGELAREPVLALYDAIPTSSEPMRLETASRHIWQHHSQIHVTRDGTVDWRYAPIEEGMRPDDLIFDENGEILSPIDEFNAPYGAAFCGDGGFDIPVGGLESEIPPYDACMKVDLMTNLLYAFFEIEPGGIPLPLPSSLQAGTTTTRFGPVPTLDADGEVRERDLLVGFFPGEPLSMYAEQWRRRSAAELGVEMPLLVGYAQDHEGYLLIPEDWFAGGYEPNIAIWGPLQGEHIMERTLEYTAEILGTTDVREDPDPYGWYAPTPMATHPLPTVRPDTTPDAGTRVVEPPVARMWVPQGFELDLDIPEAIARGSGQVQLLWKGGDPAVDLPRVVLERLEDEVWEEVLTHSQRPVTDTLGDILMGWTPSPLYPASGDQVHTWWAVWQAAAHDGDRLALPVGTYRLKVTGKRYTGQAETWPWDTEGYVLEGPAFEVRPAQLSAQPVEGGVSVWVDGGPSGYRLLDLDGQSNGDNPVRGPLTFEVTTDAGTTSHTLSATSVAGRRAFYALDLQGALALTLTDASGNTGSLSF